MPPASLPTASIFCACRSWSSLVRRASSARLRSVRSTVRPRSWPAFPGVSGTTWTMSRSQTISPVAVSARYSSSWSSPRASAPRHLAMTLTRSSGWMRLLKKSGSSSQRSGGKPKTVWARWLTNEKRSVAASASHTMASRPCTRSWKRCSDSLRAACRRSSSERSSTMSSSRASSCSSMRMLVIVTRTRRVSCRWRRWNSNGRSGCAVPDCMTSRARCARPSARTRSSRPRPRTSSRRRKKDSRKERFAESTLRSAERRRSPDGTEATIFSA